MPVRSRSPTWVSIEADSRAAAIMSAWVPPAAPISPSAATADAVSFATTSRRVAVAVRRRSAASADESVACCAARSSAPASSSCATSFGSRAPSWSTAHTGSVGLRSCFTVPASSSRPAPFSSAASASRAAMNPAGGSR